MVYRPRVAVERTVLAREQPKLTSTKYTDQECTSMKEPAYQIREKVPNERDSLLDRNPYWKTLRITAWVLRFVSNSLSNVRGLKKRGPITTDEVETARNCWICRVQRDVNEETEATGWRLVKDEDNGI